jgi:hypothetical protein
MKERIHRVKVLFKELGYEVYEGESSEDSFTAVFEHENGFQGGFFIDSENKFWEVAFTFSFSTRLGSFVQKNLEEMLGICYEYGCYMNLQKFDGEISFSVFSKVYYAGLNYYSLKETLRDFKDCVESLTEVCEITKD